MIIKIGFLWALLILAVALVNILFYHQRNIGVIYPLFFAGEIFLLLFWPNRQTVGPLGFLLALQAVIMVGLSVLMCGVIIKYRPRHRQDRPATVIVLGGYVRGNSPGRILQARLDCAARYLRQNPHCYCVVSGGQGPNEQFAEAAVMARYLANAIAAERLYCEANSHTTAENLSFSLALMTQKQLPQKVIIVSSDFHLYRAAKIWRQLTGERPYLLAARTPLVYQQTYWVREYFAILTDSRRRLRCLWALLGK